MTETLLLLENAPAAATDLTFTNSLVAYFQMEEASGTRADFTGRGNDLTDHSVGTAAGKVNQAASFVRASTHYLSRADTADLSNDGSSFSIVAWVYGASLPADMVIIDKETSPNADYRIRYNYAEDKFEFDLFDAGGNPIGNVLSTETGFSDSTWIFIAAVYGGGAVKISVNGGAFNTAAVSGTPNDSAAAFNIGREGWSGSAYFDGRVDEVGIFKTALTAGNVTYLYNGGTGRTPPFAP